MIWLTVRPICWRTTASGLLLSSDGSTAGRWGAKTSSCAGAERRQLRPAGSGMISRLTWSRCGLPGDEVVGVLDVGLLHPAVPLLQDERPGADRRGVQVELPAGALARAGSPCRSWPSTGRTSAYGVFRLNTTVYGSGRLHLVHHVDQVLLHAGQGLDPVDRAHHVGAGELAAVDRGDVLPLDALAQVERPGQPVIRAAPLLRQVALHAHRAVRDVLPDLELQQLAVDDAGDRRRACTPTGTSSRPASARRWRRRSSACRRSPPARPTGSVPLMTPVTSSLFSVELPPPDPPPHAATTSASAATAAMMHGQSSLSEHSGPSRQSLTQEDGRGDCSPAPEAQVRSCERCRSVAPQPIGQRFPWCDLCDVAEVTVDRMWSMPQHWE